MKNTIPTLSSANLIALKLNIGMVGLVSVLTTMLSTFMIDVSLTAEKIKKKLMASVNANKDSE